MNVTPEGFVVALFHKRKNIIRSIPILVPDFSVTNITVISIFLDKVTAYAEQLFETGIIVNRFEWFCLSRLYVCYALCEHRNLADKFFNNLFIYRHFRV